jgi:Sap, sulfolipid-1-addressing protein
MGWIDAELALTAIAAMLSPTTLSFSVLALVLGDRPLRTGVWFYLGALVATLAIGVAAAFVLGDKAASATSYPKPWVAVVDIVLAFSLVFFSVRFLRRPRDPKRAQSMVDQMSKIASSPWIAIVAAGATLANPGGFIPIAMKDISETNPSRTGFIVEWVFFSVVSLLPLAVAVIMLAVSPDLATRLLLRVRDWLLRNARLIAAAIMVLLAAVLLRDGISGLTHMS